MRFGRIFAPALFVFVFSLAQQPISAFAGWTCPPGTKPFRLPMAPTYGPSFACQGPNGLSEPVADAGPKITPEQLVEVLGSKKCVDSTNSQRNGVRPHAWDCQNGNNNQKWQFIDRGKASDGNPYVSIRLSRNSTYCLDVKSFSTQNGGEVQLWSCSGADNQAWKVYGRDKNGWTNLQNKHSGRCLGLDSSNHNNGAVFIQWACNTAVADQRFRSKPVQ